MLFFFPDTKGVPLEEIAAIFGDADEVAIYQRDIEMDHNAHTIIDRSQDVAGEKTTEPITSENVGVAKATEDNV